MIGIADVDALTKTLNHHKILQKISAKGKKLQPIENQKNTKTKI